MSVPYTEWSRQLAAIMRIEIKRTLFSFRTAPVYLLALLPVAAAAMGAIVTMFFDDEQGVSELGVQATFGAAYAFLLTFPVYFGCVWLFVNLIRGEMIDRSLHYYFLSPIRREILVAGKYLSGVAVASMIFCTATALTFLFLRVPLGLSLMGSDLFAGGGLGQLLKYVAIVALACAGYGALFIVIGLFFKNPIIPALAIWAWETIGHFLPATLQKLSVRHHLSGLKPLQFDGGEIVVVLGEPTSALAAITGIVVVSSALLLLSCWRARQVEIDYAAE